MINIIFMCLSVSIFFICFVSFVICSRDSLRSLSSKGCKVIYNLCKYLQSSISNYMNCQSLYHRWPKLGA